MSAKASAWSRSFTAQGTNPAVAQEPKRFGKRVALNDHPDERLPNTLNVSFIGKVGSEILSRMEGVAASSGSACHSGSVELSPVLKTMNILPEVGMGAIRFSLGRTTTREQIEATTVLLCGAVLAS